MAKELFISSTPHETKVAVVEDEQLSEIYFERENEYTLAGSIYKGRVTRVLPGMQSAFVDIGLERDAFLYVTDFLEEQEDQDDFESVAPRAHSEVRQQHPQAQQQPSHTIEESTLAGSGEKAESASPPGGQSGERGPRRWRGRRGRGRSRGQSPEQSTAAAATQQEVEPQQGNDSEADSIVLPGESLSKYRKTISTQQTLPSESPSEPANRSGEHHSEPQRTRREFPVQPQTSELRTGESSVSLLPGESLSKYRSRGETPEPPAQNSPAPERHEARTEHRFERNRQVRNSFEAPTGTPLPTLPGESLAKYRGASTSTEEARAVVQEHNLPHSEVLAQSEQSLEHVESKFSTPEHFRHEITDERAHQPSPDQIRFVGSEPGSPEVSSAAVIDEQVNDFEAGHEHHEASADFHSSEKGDEGPVPHDFGAGVLEEEVLDEEETDIPVLSEHLDEEIYEELEEETLDLDNAEQLVEAVREAHVSQRLGLQDGEPSDLEDHPQGELVDRFVPDGGDSQSLSDASDVESHEDSEGQGELDQDHDEQDEQESVEEEGRAELRAAPNTAGFQQRTERTDRAVPDRFRRGRHGRPMRGRRNTQRESQPTISDLLKEGQEILVQIAKEPMAKKGARITSHIALPGRFLVYMPTVNHVGVSRKIGSDEERQRLKQVLISEKGAAHGGFIVRTAASGASEEDLRSDLRFLINLWNDIKARSESSKAPSLIYHDLNLVERILRDQVTSNFSSVWVDTEQEYERIVRFLGRFQASMVKRAKLYTKDTPLFEQFGIQEEINNALKSKVWLKSGGYIVINQTEALVAIDINTGKYVGKTTRLEDTIVKTNIDAIREIVRQIRLRDLGGIIVIDFIDMDERKNRQKVMQALEEELKSDRAPSKVLQFNDFGLVAITRKRVKQSLERTLSTSCVYCAGTGMIKSVQTVCNEIYVEMRKMSRHLERHDVLLRVNPEVVKALKANNARWLQEMEELTGKTIIVKSDPVLHQEQFDIN
jgi:ribonuclease G